MPKKRKSVKIEKSRPKLGLKKKVLYRYPFPNDIARVGHIKKPVRKIN